jgi:hypothetical protein
MLFFTLFVCKIYAKHRLDASISLIVSNVDVVRSNLARKAYMGTILNIYTFNMRLEFARNCYIGLFLNVYIIN